MDKIKSLLNQIALIDKKNREILDATGGRFNMFRICGVNHYETKHSAIIAELLNPKGTHGLKSKFLTSFVKELKVVDFDCENAVVRTEYVTEQGRIDILIEDKQNKAIIIENKVYAKDQIEQLKRYNKYAQTYKNGYQILYLTLWGDNASEQSGESVPYLAISYKYDIINWLEKCVSISSRYPIVRETIIQYINHLKELTNQDMNTKNKEDITEILSQIDNLRIAKVIFQNYSSTFNYIIEKYFNPKMIEFANKKGLEYHYETSDEAYVRFYLTDSKWQGKYWIGFTFEGNRFFYGLCNDFNNYRILDNNRKNLHAKLNELDVFNRKESNWWPFYSYIPNLTLDNWENDIIKSDTFIKSCEDKISTLLNIMSKIDL